MSLQSPLGKVGGLGSAKEGVSHWWYQRLTAIALAPLPIFFRLAVFAFDQCHRERSEAISGPQRLLRCAPSDD
jgi:succinate dehydrogenase hydrophobic anchor subunit